MEKRVVIAAALSITVLVLWGWLFPPPKRQPAIEPAPAIAEQVRPDPLAAAEPEVEAAMAAAPGPQGAPLEPVAPVAAQAEERIDVERDLYAVTLTNAGGRILSWKLREYSGNGGESLELLPQLETGLRRTFALELDDPELTAALADALYRVERSAIDRGERLVFTWSDGRGIEARKALTFHDGTYLVDVEIEVADRGRRLPARVVLGPGFGAQEARASRGTYYYAGQAAWSREGSVTRVKKTKLEEPGRFVSRLQWAGLEDQYFAVLVLPGPGETQVSWSAVEVMPEAPAAEGETVEPVSEPLLAVSVPEAGARVFVGPKKYTLLRELGDGLDGAVWFASNTFLSWIARFIFLALLWIHDHTIPNYGLAIVLATFLLRLLLFPVNQYSMVSMKKTQLQMQRLQPKIKRIREKYKKVKDSESRAKMNQETMELYRTEGVNPMGGLNGCLPLLAQFPILIGFYNMLTVAIELRGAPFFGWIHDLSQADPYWVTPVLMGGTMFLQQRMAMSKVKDPVQMQQQRMMMIMPVVFTWICLQMPAGMVLYWFVNNLLGIGQQWLVNRHTSRLEEAAEQGA